MTMTNDQRPTHFSFVCIAIMLLSALALVGACSGEPGGGSGARGTLTDKRELFDRRYNFLLRGDDGFPTLTGKYKSQTQIVEDNISRVEVVPNPSSPTDGKDSCQIITVTLKDTVSVQAVVADSIGSGLVAFEFGELPPGKYTFGSTPLPPELSAWTEECKRLVISLVVGRDIRHRARWKVTEHGKLSHELSF